MAAMTLPLIFWGFFHEFCEAGQHDFKHTAELAGFQPC